MRIDIIKAETTPKLTHSPSFLGLILASSYVGLSGTYIILSTMMAGKAVEDETALVQLELAKGLLFVLITGIALYFGARFLLAHIVKKDRKIEEQRRSIEELDRRAASGLLASAIGHDANNLLTAIRMSVDMLKLNITNERRVEMTQSLSKIVDELMVLNRRLVEGGRADQPGELKVLCLKSESERIMVFLDESHPVSRLDLSFTGDDRAETLLNRHLYFQVLLNLLTNVVRHAGECAKVCVHIEDFENKVEVSVEDSGPGVPKEIRERIFEPYFSRHDEGSGLGLSSVRAIMRMHQGEVRCEDSSLGGAKFLLIFPKRSSN
ncbi:sensor histidine kinase [Cerasicoccus arenae]|uniref:histidine kinase n=1 Tax=Cerasicoccus arenae TaxID=424488 RepID=A0A8J3D9S3_9BACT|nr:HAMP domain-containing sensor histidine kinase [Cerasicoccus arenae]MBK1857151.1 HAMP domain-containing histidine kinase [Cerasicoccus arenae]GHB92649.1 hypothetical protein GCM10007047_04820 [Cerasicoccus arenae]